MKNLNIDLFYAVSRLLFLKGVFLGLFFTSQVFAFTAEPSGSMETQLLTLQKQWAITHYTLKDDSQLESFTQLIKQAEDFTQLFPDSAESWAWRGIIESSYAGAEGGLGALSWAKKAKKSFEKSIKINEQALQGSAYTSLGVLYHKVPGWPISFGDDDKAKLLLEKALAINPTGIDTNYFYGEFLYDKGEKEKAVLHLQKAKQATPRATRPLADSSRQQEIETLLTTITEQ